MTIPTTRRATVCAKISRHELSGLLRLFDFPDANITADRRSETTVPQQQLFVLNSAFMVNQAKAFAGPACRRKRHGDDPARGFAEALCCLPSARPALTDDEVTLALRYILAARTPAEEAATQHQLTRCAGAIRSSVVGQQRVHVCRLTGGAPAIDRRSRPCDDTIWDWDCSRESFWRSTQSWAVCHIRQSLLAADSKLDAALKGNFHPAKSACGGTTAACSRANNNLWRQSSQITQLNATITQLKAQKNPADLKKQLAALQAMKNAPYVHSDCVDSEEDSPPHEEVLELLAGSPSGWQNHDGTWALVR